LLGQNLVDYLSENRVVPFWIGKLYLKKYAEYFMIWNIWFVFGVLLIFVVVAIYFASRRKKVEEARRNPKLKETGDHDAIGRTEFIENHAPNKSIKDSNDDNPKTKSRLYLYSKGQEKEDHRS